MLSCFICMRDTQLSEIGSTKRTGYRSIRSQAIETTKHNTQRAQVGTETDFQCPCHASPLCTDIGFSLELASVPVHNVLVTKGQAILKLRSRGDSEARAVPA